MAVPVATWWPRLRASTREWLIEHNGEPLPAPTVAELEGAAEEPVVEAWWAGAGRGDDVEPSDEFVDWLDAVANGERPPDPRP